MNRIDFSYTGGFPLETDTLDFLQKSMTGPINALTWLGGDNYIISGITDDGHHTTDGWVVISGEILLPVQSLFVVKQAEKPLH